MKRREIPTARLHKGIRKILEIKEKDENVKRMLKLKPFVVRVVHPQSKGSDDIIRSCFRTWDSGFKRYLGDAVPPKHP